MKYKTVIGKTVELTEERLQHIKERHPDIIEHFSKIKQILSKPDQTRIDNLDPKVLLFYAYTQNALICNFKIKFWVHNRLTRVVHSTGSVQH